MADSAPYGVVSVSFDYLRLGMGYLELPLQDGSIIKAENAVFEDRGNGNLMWTGDVPGAGYESVLLTVQDEYLVGWLDRPTALASESISVSLAPTASARTGATTRKSRRATRSGTESAEPA